MGQADIETLRRVYAAASSGNWDAVFAELPPDIEWRSVRAGTHRGHEEVRAFLEDMTAAFEEAVFEPEEFFEFGDQIVVYAHFKTRPSGSNATIENRVGHLWTMRNGTPVLCQTFPRREDALEAAAQEPT